MMVKLIEMKNKKYGNMVLSERDRQRKRENESEGRDRERQGKTVTIRCIQILYSLQCFWEKTWRG